MTRYLLSCILMVLFFSNNISCQEITLNRKLVFNQYWYAYAGGSYPAPFGSIAQARDGSYKLNLDFVYSFEIDGSSTNHYEVYGDDEYPLIEIACDTLNGKTYIASSDNKLFEINETTNQLFNTYTNFTNPTPDDLYQKKMIIDGTGRVWISLKNRIYLKGVDNTEMEFLGLTEVADIEYNYDNEVFYLSNFGESKLYHYQNETWEPLPLDEQFNSWNFIDFEFLPNGHVLLLGEDEGTPLPYDDYMIIYDLVENQVVDQIPFEPIEESIFNYNFFDENILSIVVDGNGVIWIYLETLLYDNNGASYLSSNMHAYYEGEWYLYESGESNLFPVKDGNRSREIIVNNEGKVILPDYACAAPNFPFSIYEFELDGIVNSSEPKKEEYAISIYPNPTSEAIYIQLNSEVSEVDDITYTLFDATGKEVYSESKLLGNELVHKIDIQEQPSGIYFLQVTSPKDNKSKYEKVIIH